MFNIQRQWQTPEKTVIINKIKEKIDDPNKEVSDLPRYVV